MYPSTEVVNDWNVHNDDLELAYDCGLYLLLQSACQLRLLDNDDLELAHGCAGSGLCHPRLPIVAPYVSLSLHNSVFPQYLARIILIYPLDIIQVCIFVVPVSKYNSAKYTIDTRPLIF